MYSIQIINELRQLGDYTCTFVVVNDESAYPELRVDKNFSADVSPEQIETEKENTLDAFMSMLVSADKVDKDDFLSNILQ